MNLDELTAHVQRFAAAHVDAPVTARNVGPMEDGHAGLTFGFELVHAGGAVEAFVMRLAPKGVKRKGNTDVYRQAPLMRALHAAGLPVPPVRWAGEDEQWFEVPYVIMERLPGRTLMIWEPHAEFRQGPAFMATLWHQAAEALARFHRFDWQTSLAGWEEPVAVLDEIHKWDRILAQSPEPAWLAQGEAVRELLLRRPPPETPIGLFHGDYQPGNVLYDQGRMVAVVDWELAGIGGQLLDIGWLLTFGDPQSWHPTWCPVQPPPAAELIDIYEQGMGRPMPAIPWYQAFAGYRFGVISCLNVKLHRRGQRHDPTWERFAPAIPHLFGRAHELLLEFG